MKLMFKKFVGLMVSVALLNGLVMLTAPARSYALFDNSKNQACAGIALSNTPVNCDPNASSTGIGKILTTALNILSIVVGIAAVVMIIVGGLRLVLSGGDSNNVNSARNSILYAIVGLVIAAFAQILVHFVLNKIKN